jgi:hypothetical protein
VAGHLRGQPIGCVVLAQTVALFAIDQRLVKRLHYVALDFGQTEAPDMRHDASDQLCSVGVSDDPVEEIALYSSVDSRACKRLARQEPGWAVLIEAEDGEGDAFGDHNEIRVLKLKRIVLDILAVDDPKKLRP